MVSTTAAGGQHRHTSDQTEDVVAQRHAGVTRCRHRGASVLTTHAQAKPHAVASVAPRFAHQAVAIEVDRLPQRLGQCAAHEAGRRYAERPGAVQQRGFQAVQIDAKSIT